MTMMTRRAVMAASGALSASIATGSLAQAITTPPARLRSFKPGALWLDTSGKPIQAHGASILKVGDLYYWYGENKEFTTGKTKVWTWGVRCYSSTDLYNWDDLGLIIPPDQTDPASPLNPTVPLDRPHILYNARTKTFVCWVKIMDKGRQTRTVLTADKITGPYTIVRRNIQPLGMNAGDFDLCFSPDDGKAYMYFERVHSEMICADLTDDYTDFTGFYSTHFPHPAPPLVREGPAWFRRKGKHYLATSGTSGYFPNPSEIAVADTFHGPFTVLGDLHPRDISRTSFNSQISAIFRHPAKQDLYIALADRWLGPQTDADFTSGKTSGLVRGAIAKALGMPRQPMTKEESGALKYLGLNVDTSQARYVWLPIRFDKDDRPTIEWRDEWTLEEFA